jgi:hypothetical protein
VLDTEIEKFKGRYHRICCLAELQAVLVNLKVHSSFLLDVLTAIVDLGFKIKYYSGSAINCFPNHWVAGVSENGTQVLQSNSKLRHVEFAPYVAEIESLRWHMTTIKHMLFKYSEKFKMDVTFKSLKKKQTRNKLTNELSVRMDVAVPDGFDSGDKEESKALTQFLKEASRKEPLEGEKKDRFVRFYCPACQYPAFDAKLIEKENTFQIKKTNEPVNA